jgi:hypothetical protein
MAYLLMEERGLMVFENRMSKRVLGPNGKVDEAAL